MEVVGGGLKTDYYRNHVPLDYSVYTISAKEPSHLRFCPWTEQAGRIYLFTSFPAHSCWICAAAVLQQLRVSGPAQSDWTLCAGRWWWPLLVFLQDAACVWTVLVSSSRWRTHTALVLCELLSLIPGLSCLSRAAALCTSPTESPRRSGSPASSGTSPTRGLLCSTC